MRPLLARFLKAIGLESGTTPTEDHLPNPTTIGSVNVGRRNTVDNFEKLSDEDDQWSSQRSTDVESNWLPLHAIKKSTRIAQY